MKVTIRLLFFLISVIFCSNASSQEYSDHTIFAHAGYGMSTNAHADGSGVSWGMGYQKGIWTERLRLVPSFSFGKYTNRGIQNVASVYFNSISLKTNVNFDVITSDPFCLFVGTGFTFNYSSGLTGAGVGESESTSLGGYFNEANASVNVGLGFRISQPNRLFGYEVHLFNASLQNKKNFSEVVVLQLRLLMHLK